MKMGVRRKVVCLAALTLSTTTTKSTALKLWGSDNSISESDTAIGSSSTSSNGKDNYHFEDREPIQNQEVNSFGQPT